jgi:hypothetical protein
VQVSKCLKKIVQLCRRFLDSQNDADDDDLGSRGAARSAASCTKYDPETFEAAMLMLLPKSPSPYSQPIRMMSTAASSVAVKNSSVNTMDKRYCTLVLQLKRETRKVGHAQEQGTQSGQ